MAVQIAHAMGAEVTAVCSSANINFVRSLGASQVIDYTKSDLLEQPTRYDGVFECVGSHSCWYYRKLLKRRGRHAGISCSRKSRIEGVAFHIATGKRSFQFHVKARHKDLELLAALIEQGKLKPIVSHVYTLAQIVEAHRQCETRRTVGKIAVQIS
jgi:NADPH:quinone reductase-like Zn-dependent oxidoreductase